MAELISIAKILNFHGIAGEAKVGFSKGAEERIKALKQVYAGKTELNVERVRFHKGFAIMKFKEISSIDELLPYKGQNLYAEKASVKENLADEEYLISDLVGLKVFDDKDDFLGTVSSIGTNTGNDLLCIKSSEGKEILIPFVKELVPIVDIKGKKLVIKPIEGLL